MVKVAVVSFGQDEVDWYRWSNNRKKVESWSDLEARMFHHFKDTGQGSLGARLIRITHDGPYNEYVKKFLNYSAPLPDMAESVLMDTFITGLEPTLQAEVASRYPQTLEECMREAQLVNDRNIALKLAEREKTRLGGGISVRKGMGKDKEGSGRNDFLIKQVTIPIKSNYNKGETPAKRLTDSEFRARLDKGLCFRCNERYSSSHRCKFKEKRDLMLIIMNEEEEEDESITRKQDEKVMELKALEVPTEAEIELKTLMGFASKGTMKLKGKVLNKEVIILIDSGATHNFVHQTLVEELKLPIVEGTSFGVTIGDGSNRTGIGLCPRIEVRLPELTIIADFFAIELGRVDVILGMQWLSTTGCMKIDWPTLTMSFKVGERKIKLRGDPSLIKVECSLKTITKLWEEDDQGFLLEFQKLEVEEEQSWEEDVVGKREEEDLPMIQFLLRQYQDLFNPPKVLPPKREVDHHILALPDQKPINVRPYKYGRLQKEEIEKLVEEMLIAGVIRPSHSPYSSPVLLVKKKDRGWRFCVKYRKLNQVTVADKFPIPVIEELLDD